MLQKKSDATGCAGDEMSRCGAHVFVYAAGTETLDNVSVFEKGLCCVPRERQEKVRSFVFKKDRLLSLGAGLLLVWCLREHGISSFRMGYGTYGKPFLKEYRQNNMKRYRQAEDLGNNCQAKDPENNHQAEDLKKNDQAEGLWENSRAESQVENNHTEDAAEEVIIQNGAVGQLLQFNLSHGGQRVLCVISGEEVGCDVEKITAENVDENLAQAVFTQSEYEKFVSCRNEKERAELFFTLWTRKESLMKATGLGVNLSPKSFRVDLPDPVDGWHIRDYNPGDGYRYAVCSRAKSFDPCIREVDLARAVEELF